MYRAERKALKGAREMKKGIEMVGQVFGNVYVSHETEAYRSPRGQLQRRFECSCLLCGSEFVVRGDAIRQQKVTDCGCGVVNQAEDRLADEGPSKARARTYQVWRQMILRCHGFGKGYEYYRLKGVRVCEDWRESFDNFVEDIGIIPPGMQLDRIDPRGDYSPENVRLVTPAQNRRNLRMHKPKEEKEEITPELRTLLEAMADVACDEAVDKCSATYHDGSWTVMTLGKGSLGCGWSPDLRKAIQESIYCIV